MTLVPVPGGQAPNLGIGTDLGAWLDRAILGTQHLWSQAKTWDPEGLLSTLPAIGTGIIGMLTGSWIKREPDHYKRLTGILATGAILFALGLMWNEVFPINKKLWTSSYVLYVGGLAMLFLGVVYWLVDVLGYKSWSKPFLVLGVNPLFAYILSDLIAITMGSIRLPDGGGETQSLHGWVYEHFFTSWLSPMNASLAYAVCNVLVCLAIAWPLYRRKIYIKV
jgi:predicted acyltransferase